MSESRSPRGRRSSSDDRERLSAIEEMLRDQARREQLRGAAYRWSRTSLRARVAVGVVVLAAFLTWLIPVPGLEPDIPFPMPPEEEEAGLRLATYVQAQQVEAFRLNRGRLPDVLRETGEPLPGMSYQRMDARTYRLSGVTERVSVSWISSDSIDSLLRDSARRVRGFAP